MAIGSAYAQSTDAQKRIHMAAERICAKIDVDKAHKEAFISIYQSYKKDMSSSELFSALLRYRRCMI